MITVKVWQLMLIGLGIIVAAAALMTMGHKGSAVASAPVETPQEQAQAQQVVNVGPIVQAYFVKHKSYVRMKLAPATGVFVMSETPATYCLESTGAAPHVFKNGPTAPLMVGTCAAPARGQPLTH